MQSMTKYFKSPKKFQTQFKHKYVNFVAILLNILILAAASKALLPKVHELKFNTRRMFVCVSHKICLVSFE